MSNPHNHPPRCCCGDYPEVRPTSITICPACPQHGELSELRNTIVDTGTLFVSAPPNTTERALLPDTDDLRGIITADLTRACSRPGSNRGDGRGCTDPHCPRHGEPDEDGPGPDPYAGRQVYTRNDGSVI